MMLDSDFGYLGSVNNILGFIDLCIFEHNFTLFYPPINDVDDVFDIGSCRWLVGDFMNG